MARKYQILCDELRRMVSQLPENASLPSVRKLMETYSLSQATVDRALRELRAERLVATINGEGSYVIRQGPPSGAPAKLRVAFIINDYHSSFSAGVENALKAHLDANGDELSILRYPWTKRLSSVVRPGHADALIVLPSEYISLKDLNFLQSLDIPVVCLSVLAHGTPLDAVGTDNELGGMMAADFLIKEGHERLAILLGEPRGSTIDPRVSGFCRQAMMAGLPPPELLDVKVKQGEGAMLMSYEHLRSELRKGRPSYSAVFAVSDACAIAANRAFHDVGLRVPEDVSILGFGDIPEAFMSVPSISTFSQGLDAWASNAMEIIGRRLSGDAEGPLRRMLPAKLVVRESTCRAAGKAAASA